MTWVKEIIEERPDRDTYLVKTYAGLIAEISKELHVIDDLFDTEDCFVGKNDLGEYKLIAPKSKITLKEKTDDSEVLMKKVLKLLIHKDICDAGFFHTSYGEVCAISTISELNNNYCLECGCYYKISKIENHCYCKDL